MHRLVSAALLAVLALGCGPANSQSPPDRSAQILANLVHEIPQLDGADLRIDSLEASGIDGWDRGLLMIPGRGGQPFLVSEDTEALFFLASDEIDVSRTTDALAAARVERLRAEADEAAQVAADLAEAVAGLPARGNPEGAITIVEFSDFECSFCKRASATVEQVLAQNPDVKLVYAHFPLAMHPWAEPAAVASTCAAQQSQDAFWTLHDAYFEQQRQFTVQTVIPQSRAALAGAGIDLAAWETCATDASSDANQAAAAAVQAQMALGEELGVRGTPAFFVEGRFLNGAQPVTAFEQTLDDVRAASAE